jgi:integral membrane protein
MAALRAGEVAPDDIEVITGSKYTSKDTEDENADNTTLETERTDEGNDSSSPREESPRDKVKQLFAAMSPLK